MKNKWFRKAEDAIQKALRLFALYGAIPLVCGGMIGLLLFVHATGTSQAAQALAAAGQQSLVGIVGGSAIKHESPHGFYFPSGELLPPMHEDLAVVLGNSVYFSPEIAPVPPAEEKTDETPNVKYTALPAGATPIIACDLSSKSFCINTTSQAVDIEGVKKANFPVEAPSGNEPLVLVLHTHGTEGYFEDHTNLSDFATDNVQAYFLPESTSFRTTDPKKSMVRVGEVFSETLMDCGIATLHVTTMHDQGDFNSAYTKSGQTVKKMLEKYPSIRYVIDLHRDSVVRGDSYVKSYTTVENTPSAQVMLVVGAGKHENWEKNLVVAANFKEKMDQKFPSLSRALYLRTARYNQQYLPGCLLLEVGSAANTLEEAENAARFAALAFAELIQSQT